jgi:rubrerythrin
VKRRANPISGGWERLMAEDKKKINTFEEALDFAISREIEAYDFYMK